MNLNNDMLPGLPLKNRPNSAMGNSISFCDLAGRDIIFLEIKYGENIFFGQFRQIMVFAMSNTAFFGAILHVLLGRTNEKVARVNAKSVITRMANIKTRWDWSFMDLPRCSMRNRRPTWVVIKIKHAISGLFGYIANPKPTLTSFFNFWPESFFNSFGGGALHMDNVI